MRRNISRRGNQQNSVAGAGPLMTGHLQDIEMQLEFLKRKREMIEQEQELLVMEQQFKSSASRHSYGQMRYDEPDQHGSNRDFSHFNETGSNYVNPFGRKRQADHQWQYDNASKRIPSKKRSQNQSQFNQRVSGNIGSGNFRNPRPTQGQGPKFAPRQPAPLMDIKVPKQSIGQKIANQKAPRKTPNKDFAPSKVSKPKAPAAPIKLASHSVTERKSLVAAATESSSDGDVSRMLLPDRVPSQQVSGRLELALGAIMKNIKALVQEQPQHVPALRSIQLQRVMKQAVRERIRTVMLGKVVGSLVDILAIYREEFPEETDADILNIALEAGGVVAPNREKKIEFIESEDPGEFFRANMTGLLETRLNEMFSKLEEIYGNVATSDAAAPPEEQIDFIKKGYNRFDENTKEYKDFLNSTLKVKDLKRFLPHLLKKYIPYIIKLINVDETFQNTKAALIMKANEKAAKVSDTNGSTEGQGAATTSASETPNINHQMYILPYYVKIMGRPKLPKRRVMQVFLNKFNPKSIKKHRTIHNLLFVGFNEKTDFDAMVGADGTVIERSTLSIKVGSRTGLRETNGENNDTSFFNDVSQVEIKQEDQKKDDIIPSELDGQITDLLLSIRKSEEEETANNGNGEETSEGTAINDGDENPLAGNICKQEAPEQVEEDVQDDEAMNAATQENNENVTEGNADENVTEENVDENVTEENVGDDNTASREDEVTDNFEAQNDSETQNMETTDQANTKNSEVSNETEKPTSDDSNKEENSQKTNGGEAQLDTNSTETASAKTEGQADDKFGELKNSGRSTPTRMSARLANVTPSTIRTRRASKLATQN